MLILFDLKKPSNACSGALVLGPLISLDLILICLSRPSKTKTNLFGVEKEKFFLDLIDFFSNKFLKSSKIFLLNFFEAQQEFLH